MADNVGRTGQDILKVDLAAALIGPTVAKLNVGGKTRSSSKLAGAVNDAANATGDNSAKSDREWVEKLIDFLENFKKGGKGSTDTGTVMTRVATATEGLLKASKINGIFWVSISNIGPAAQRAISKAISLSDCCTAASSAMKAAAKSNGSKGGSTNVSGGSGRSVSVPTTTGGGGGGGSNGSGGGSGAGGASSISKVGRRFIGLTQAATAAFTIMYGKMVQAMDLDPVKHVFQGALTESNAFRENLRQTLHQQIGFVASNREIEKSYKDINDSVIASGVRRGEFQKVWLHNLQRGLMLEGKGEKNRSMAVKRVMSVTTSALNTAQTLGMDVNSTNEMFMDWHYHLSMSALDIADMGRHMQTVARNTGLTGKELDKAMASSDKIMKSLKGAGLASADASKNVMSITAAAQKYGVGDKAGEILNSISSRSNLFKSDPKMIAMLSRGADRAGLQGQLQSGSILQSPKMTKKLFQGVQDDFKDFFQNWSADFADVGIDSSKMDMSDLSRYQQQLAAAANDQSDPKKAGSAQRALGAITQLAESRGMTVGQLEQFGKVITEMQKTSGDRINDMTQKMQDMQKKGQTGLDEYTQLQKQLAQAQTDQSMSAFTKLQEEMKKSGVATFDKLGKEAKDRLENSLGEKMGQEAAKEFLGNMGQSANQLMQNVSERAAASGLDVNSMLQKRGINSMEQAAKMIQQGGDSGETAMLALNNAMKQIGQKERVSQDPITNIRDTLTKMNNRLGGWLDDALGPIGSGVAQVVFWVGQAVAYLGSILAAISLYTAANSASGIGGAAAGIGGSLGSISGLLGVLMLATGAIKGYAEAEAAKRTKGEGAVFGALTGGAGTGSWVSKQVGVKEGSAGDKAIGVGTSAVWAAAIGAAIGTFILPGVGTAIGAGVGLLVGAITEIVKILTEGTTIVQTYFLDPIVAVFSGIWSVIKGIGSVISAIAGLGIWGWLGNILLKIGETIFYIVAIVAKPFIVLFQKIGELLSFIGGIIAPAIPYIQAFGELLLWVLETGWRPLGKTIEFVGMLVTKTVEGIHWCFKWLYEALYGHSIVPDLVEGIIKFFLMLPLKIFGALAGLAAGILKAVGSVLWTGLNTVLGGIPGMLLTGFKTVFGTLFSWLGGLVGGLVKTGADIVGGFQETNAQASERIKEKGYSATRGVGRTAGGLWETLSGGEGGLFSLAGRWEGIKKTFGGAWETIAGIGVGIGDLASGAWSGVTGMFSNAWDGVTGFFGGVGEWFTGAMGGIGDMASSAWNGVTSFFGSIGGWFTGAMGGIGDMASSAWDGVTSFFGGVGEWFTGAMGGIGDMASNAWDGVTSFFGGVGEWFTGAMSGIGDMASSAWDGVTGFFGSIGGWFSGAMSGIGDLASSAWDGATGFLSDSLSSAGKFLGGLVGNENLVGDIGGAIGTGLSSVGSMISSSPLNPLNWFEDGTKEVDQGGLAVLHPGEMIIPRSVWDQIKAVGTGAFGTGGPEKDMFGNIFDMLSSPNSMLDNVISGIGSMFGNTSTAGQKSSDINSLASSALVTKDGKQKKQVLAQLSNALDYEQSASEVAIHADKAEISTNTLDYSDQIAGEVSTLGMSRATVEDNLEKERAGTASAGSSIVPSMDAIAEYLISTHSGKLDDIIERLDMIVSNTGNRESLMSSIIGAVSGGMPMMSRPGVKSIARDTTRGFWDLTFGDNAAGVITTEGRGGSA